MVSTYVFWHQEAAEVGPLMLTFTSASGVVSVPLSATLAEVLGSALLQMTRPASGPPPLSP
jgi:hypothetical protein